MPQPDRNTNALRRQRLTRRLAPVARSVAPDTLRCAPYALRPYPSPAQQEALIEQAIELGVPPGTVLAREIPDDGDGVTLEVLCGWERVEAYLHRDAYSHARKVPLGVIAADPAEAVFYAIEHAAREHQAAGYATSPLAYAVAARQAMVHVSTPQRPWSIQDLANALCIARPTLSNRLRLLQGLHARVRDLVDRGALRPEFAKILLAEPSPVRQRQLAEQAATGRLSTRALYRLVHPDYTPPRLVGTPRRQHTQRLGDLGILERTLTETYGAPTRIALDDEHQHAGYVELSFYSLSELQGLLARLVQTAQTDTLFRGELVLKTGNPRDTQALLQELGAINEPI